MSTTNLIVGPGESDNEAFGRLLEDLRLSNGLTRAQAAKKIGISSEYIRLIERGKRAPANGQARHILEIYGKPCVLGRNQLIFDDVTVTFTSRIQAAREQPEAEQNVVSLQALSRAERIGLIIDLLADANENKLSQVHQLLLRN